MPRRSHTPRNRIRSEYDIGQRAEHLFKVLVEQYLDDGNPVGSKKLASTSALSLSSASVRLVMSDLEDLGLVTSPHTSAGKVPTERGIRFFIDSLISVRPLEPEAQEYVRSELHEDLSPQNLVQAASHLLSDVSKLASLVTTPGPEQMDLRQVEFLKLSGKRVLVILVVNGEDVQNKVIETDRQYDQTELHQAANYISQEFAGLSMSTIREKVLESMQLDKDRMTRLLQTAIDVASKSLVHEHEKDYVLSGERNLMSMLSTSEDVQSLLDAFKSKSAVVHLLDQCIASEGVRLFIGHESGYRPFDDYSLISSAYEVNGEIAGVLGVIGPTRMSYDKVIPLVDVTARVLGSALTHSYP